MDRRSFLTKGVTAAAAVAASPLAFAQSEREPLDHELVGRFVSRSHFDLEAVRTMLDDEPTLVNASWDWGDGDWETGLGAASHVGNPEIANLILERGARIDVFAATMLGHTRIVKTMLEDMPTIHRVPGPHGIALLSHAVAGREAGAELVELLVRVGADVNAASRLGVTPLMVAASTGQADAVGFLLDSGADPELRDSKDRTALSWAEEREHRSVVQVLRQRG